MEKNLIELQEVGKNIAETENLSCLTLMVASAVRLILDTGYEYNLNNLIDDIRQDRSKYKDNKIEELNKYKEIGYKIRQIKDLI